VIKAYAGIGSREVSVREASEINQLADELSQQDWFVYSGHAKGSDYAFEYGAARDKSVIWLPWEGFNGFVESDHAYVVGDNEEAQASVDTYHPSPRSLNKESRAFMARNYYQIMGDGKDWPMVSFVVCCSDPSGDGGVKGGTGQAVRIAMDKNIPVFNLRELGLNGTRRMIKVLIDG
jgi:hypothetical protein